MSSYEVNTVELSLQGTPTKTVTLAPERATIVRELADVPIKAGPNKIIISGFDNRVDFDSLRVTGHGPATITDIQTSVVLRDEDFEDLFPDDDSTGEEIDSEDPDDTFGVDRSELDSVIAEIKEISAKLAYLDNDKVSSTQSLAFLDSYGRSMHAKDLEATQVAEYIDVYQKKRADLRETYEKAEVQIAEFNEKKEKLERKKERLEERFEVERDRAAKPSRKERKAKLKEKELKEKKKREARADISSFWNIYIGRVTVHIEGHGDGTLPEDRRDSASSVKKPDINDDITLSLTYVTSVARWTPRYDLMLNTPTSSGSLVYRAEYYNRSCETWKDTNVILSTSQTTFSGVDEHIPTLLPWNVALRKHEAVELEVATDTIPSKKMSNWTGALRASAESGEAKQYRKSRSMNENAPVRYPPPWPTNTSTQPPPAAGRLFGSAAPFGANETERQSLTVPQVQGQQMMQQVQAQSAPRYQLFGASANNDQRTAFGFGSAAPSHPDGANNDEDQEFDDDDDDNQLEDDASTIQGSSNVLAFRQSSRHDYGLTTTYNVPGSRTLQPSSHVRRHIIAEIELSSMTFSHVIIPKLKPAAVLKARVTNTSTTPLLRGKAGLTVDDAFLGKATIPNCNPGVPFNLNLGVDPAIQVIYSKPKVRRATTGYFNKEDCAIFTRVCRINNTKSSPVSLVVLDQIPVSEDERIRVRLIEPKGLDRGDSAKIGADVSIDPKRAKDWGKGTVHINKDGEVKWVITLQKTVDIRFVLEYEAKIPSGLEVVGL
ncbi:hypothetical protein H109_03977 [Trichophyton interdigitale MR816]|uniref:DUF4139 domain-containing protein n=1 Tax=Trichophyton interdigitale (strain MR816) TaxID=1215338 RepID=A0A059J9I3_TRIIM|nr:hypothetical protein H101_01931 [Trichophyton interdigitale H6]KDB24122.1 hypothetical protein H109_03977 [Trichophyton interdigitale MR816]